MTPNERIEAALRAGSPTPVTDVTEVRQDAADEEDEYPFIIFRRANVERLKGLLGEVLATRSTFQIECWGETRDQSDAIERQALAALSAAGFYPDGNEVDGLDPEVKVRAAVFAVDVWS
jgi:hypothetical protein